MSERLFFKNKDYCYYLFALAIILLLWFFEKYVTDVLGKVADFLSKCEHLPFAIIIIMLVVFSSVYCLWKTYGKKKEYVSHSQIAILLLVAMVYVYYRFRESSPFEFWGFEFCGYSIAWTDLLLLPLALRLFQAIVYKAPMTANESMQALLSDKSIGSAEEDLLGYNNYVKDLLADINTLDLSESYSIGITGDWGQGKSSFLNLLKQGVEKQNDLCTVFSPRNSKNVSTIQDDFFNQLNKTLSKHHTNLGHSFHRYKKALSIINTGWLGNVFSFIDALDMEDEKKAINHGIQRIGKRLFIIVEDFDRLTAEEILEVLKVIDRNGDFNNTVYLTAYDKRYINSVLSKHFGNDGVQDYSDKYFQHEYSLPAQQSAVIIDFISTYLKKALQSQDGIFDANVNKFLMTNERTIAACLPSLRHAKRFLNIFCSRFSKIKDDVLFSDFFMLTLLRYVDIKTYYALARLEIVTLGDYVNYKSKIYTLVHNIDKELEGLSSHKQSKVLLGRLFTTSEIEWVAPQPINRIQWINSFDLYFYDYRSDRAYYKDLVQLFLESSDEDAFKRLDDGLKKGHEIDIEDFLCSRKADWIKNSVFLSRLIKLLCYLNHKQGRSVTLELKISSFFEVHTAKEFSSIFNDNEYKRVVEDSLRDALSFAPYELGLLFLQEIEKLNEDKEYVTKLVFTREEFIDFATWAQKYYYQQYGSPDFNFDVAFVLANIRTKQNVLTKVVEPAKQELVAMMKLYPEDFAKEIVIPKVIDNNGNQRLYLSFYKSFLADQYFPVDGYGFDDWVSLLSSEHAQFVLRTIYGYYMDGKKPVQVDAMKEEYDKGDFESFYEAIINDRVRQLDTAVQGAIEEGSVFDLDGLKKKTRANEEEIEASIHRLVEAKVIDAKYLKLKDKVVPFVVGDFVQLRWSVLTSLNKDLSIKTNLFTISKIHDNTQYELTEWNRLFLKQELRPVFIDDEVSKNIYYDPVVAAGIMKEGEATPVHRVDYRYFMRQFESVLDYEDVSFKRRVEQKGFLYVHEVQHWLREEYGSDELKMRGVSIL